MSSRSFSTDDYFYISEKLRSKYNVISFSEMKFENDKNMYVDCHLRQWAAIIEAADYFLGIDSVGQHMAYSFDKPGTVVVGSTFQRIYLIQSTLILLKKKGVERRYSPIRIGGVDSDLADRYNDTCGFFTKKELDEIVSKIMRDIKTKIGE